MLARPVWLQIQVHIFSNLLLLVIKLTFSSLFAQILCCLLADSKLEYNP